MIDPKGLFFESHNAGSREDVDEGFVIATKMLFWQLNPIGLRVAFLPPKVQAYQTCEEGPAIVGIAFVSARIRIVNMIHANIKDLRKLFAGYESFPDAFKPDEIVRLESQLRKAKAKFSEAEKKRRQKALA